MSIDLANYEERAKTATQLFWKSRLSAKMDQKAKGNTDQGERSGVTAGKNMDGFLGLMIDVIRANGLTNVDFHIEKKVLTLPGYFRPTKLWDLLVMRDKQLIAAIELKSHVGPSFGNNFNNRCEEAIGMAHDFFVAYREGAFGDHPAPFTGWLILLEDDPKSQSAINDKAPHYPVFKEFQGASYADRYNILCRKLMQEKLYTAASVITSPRTAESTGVYNEISKSTGLKMFFSELAAHAAKECVRG